MRDHARPRKHSLNDNINRDAEAASKALKKNFWGYVNCLLGDSPSDVKPSFTVEQATTYFQGVFSKSANGTFKAPEWLTTLKCAGTPFVTCVFTLDEIVSRI